ncbi:MAG TPA: DUF4815 domain-containing protein [bacterium]|nr:DUF4815 domain-containing protein [bacterium]
MSISRETFDPAKNYKRVRYHQDRDLLDSELNEHQDIMNLERKKLADMLFKEGAIISGLVVTVADNVLTVGQGVVYVDGCLEVAPGAVLTYDPAKTSGADYVYVELLKYNYGYNQDATLINPATGEPTAEREKWVLSLKDHDTSAEALPNNVTQRKVVPIYKFDRETEEVTATVQEKSNLYLRDLLGTLPGSRITVSSITEDQLAFAAAEGLNSLLQNLAERTYDQAGSYLVKGLDSFIGDNDGDNVEVITNAGRAYIQGFRFQKDLPTTSLVPKSIAVKSVRGEQKTYVVGTRRYAVNSTPLKETTQLEAIVEIVSNITRGSVGGGEDLLVPNPVVDILEVSQGATVFVEGVDWQQSGNHVDWLGTGSEPAIGTTYTVRWTYTKQMVKNSDYVDGGWFGQSTHPAADEYFYLVTVVSATGESQYDQVRVESRETLAGEINKITWLPVSGATGYRIYRGTQNATRADFQKLKDVAAGVTTYLDDGVDQIIGGNPPATNTSGLTMSALQIALDNLSVINFGRTGVGDDPVAGSNCSVDYDYYVGRKDIIYVTTREIKRLEGAPADSPKLPVLSEGTLGLCSIECPPNSVDLTVINFGLTRITMDQIHEIIKDVEDLKYNDAQFQMNNALQNRDAQTKKGVYSDDFSNDAQSDVYHSEWSARIDQVLRFAAPDRLVSATALVVNPSASNALFKNSLALLPATERVLIQQADWSEVKNINPYAVFDKPEASLEITPNIGRRGQTGIAVVGSNFTPNATNVTVRCDGQVVASNVHADAAGRVTSSFVIPDNARNGNRIVEMTDGVNSAQANLQVNDPLVITRIERVVVERTIVQRQIVVQPTPPRIIRVPVERIVWRVQLRTRRRDPLAQTFSFSENRIVSAVGVYFTQKDATVPVTIQIRGVTTGLPNEIVLAEKVVAPGEVVLNAETKIAFADPFYAPANTSYAVVLLTNSNNYKVRIATLGQLGQNGVITNQTYTAGVLLESSNAETWTPLNGSDLTMKIYGYDFQASGEVRFQPITGVQFSDLNLDEYSSTPEGSAIVWEYSTDGGVTWDAIVPAEEERLPNLAGQVLVRALFSTGVVNDSPALNFKDVNLLGFLNNPTGAYLNRENELTQGVASTKVYAQMSIPSGTTINWFASNNGGLTWEAMSIAATREIDYEWTEYTLTRTFTDPNGNKVRYKAELTGNNLVYPRIHTLGATLS